MSQTGHDSADSSSEDSQNSGVPLGDTPRSTTSPSGSDATEYYSTTRSTEEPDDTESEDELITTEPAAGLLHGRPQDKGRKTGRTGRSGSETPSGQKDTGRYIGMIILIMSGMNIPGKM
jgi:hypothetical protein